MKPASKPSYAAIELTNVRAAYHGGVQVLHDISLRVPERGVVALLGGNGAGKTTTMRAIANLLTVERGELTGGSVVMRGERVNGLGAPELVRRGLVLVMEGRHCFAHLSIHENLLVGAHLRSSRGDIEASLDKVYRYFPRLKSRSGSLAALTSGGEQQMCAIGRALMTDPSIVLLDEPSMGLAPQVVQELFQIVRSLNEVEGVTFLIAEQNASIALAHAQFGYVLETGRIVLEGTAASLSSNDDVRASYLGMGARDRHNFRDAPTRQPKRWQMH